MTDDRRPRFLLTDLVAFNLQAGRHTAAIGLMRRNLASRLQRFGPDHVASVKARMMLGQVYLVVKDFARASVHLGLALERSDALHGDGHRRTVEIVGDLARAYRDLGQPQKAMPLFERYLAALESRLDPFAEATIAPRDALADVCADAGAVDRAVELFRDNLALCVMRYGPDDPRTDIARENLIDVLESDGRHAEATVLQVNRLHWLRPPC